MIAVYNQTPFSYRGVCPVTHGWPVTARLYSPYYRDTRDLNGVCGIDLNGVCEPNSQL